MWICDRAIVGFVVIAMGRGRVSINWLKKEGVR
jgi:hypothetical protein